jgi:vacuolar-type H+-ATPase subunit H
MFTGAKTDRNHDGDDSLSRLLEIESLLADRLEAANAEAERVLVGARDEARKTAAGGDALIEQRANALRAEYATRLATELARVREDAASEIARLEAIDDSRAHQLVAHVLARVIDRQAVPSSSGRS